MSSSQFLRRSKYVRTRRILVALFFTIAFVLIPLNPLSSTAASATGTAAPDQNLSSGGVTVKTTLAAPISNNVATTNVITWRAQDNPHIINGTYVIPADTRVLMEAGVVVQFDSDSKLQVDGELIGQGTAASRIQLQKSGNYAASILVTGTLNLGYTDVSTTISPASGDASLIFADCTFKGNGYIWTSLGYMYKSLSYIQLDRCKFENATNGVPIYTFLTVDHATLVMRDVSFTGGAYAIINYSYVYLDRITSDGASQYGLSLRVDGPLYLDNISVMNTTTGLDLGAGYRPANYFLGPNVKLQGNVYPVNLEGAGLLPGSYLPAEGNTNNAIRATYGGPGTVWGKFAVPYHLIGFPTASISGTTIAPGVNIKVAPQTTISAGGSGIRGTAAEPIHFERLDPSRDWFAIGFQDLGSIVEHTIVEGSQGGVQTASNAHSFVYLNDVILRNNEVGTGGGAYAIGSQFINNGIGYGSTGGLTAIRGFLDGGPASPNSFVGNGKAINNTSRDIIPARNNWWNSPTGPTAVNNPGGTGDPVVGGDVIPFLTAPPDYTSDRPPVVRLHKPFHTYAPGSKVTLSWNSSDDFGVVAHRVLFSKDGGGDYALLAEVPGDQRAYEWTVPDIGFQVNGLNSYVRIVAVDTKGHERFDDAEIVIPSGDFTGSVTFTTDIAGRTFKTGDVIPFEYTISDELRYSPKQEYLLIAGEGLVPQRTFHSTDTAQIAIQFSGNGNRELWFYSPVFKVRPDSRVGDQPPVVTLTSPQAGAAFTSGDVVPVTWTASDDEGVRSFNIQVSYDGGASWTTVARDLPATTTSYSLRTAPGAGHTDVRVRVTAYDRRFQSSNAGADRPFSTAGVVQNQRPTVTLTSPGAESQFNAGSPVTLTAEARDTDGTITRVDFYAGDTLIGTSTSAPYRFNWTGALAGTTALTAITTDNAGASTKSAPANVIINAQPPTPGTTAGAQWAASYNGPSNRTESGPYMALDAQGNVYLTGPSIGVGTENDITTIKYDPQGRQLWAVRYAGLNNDISHDIAVDAQGNVYVTGETWRGLNLDGGTEQDIVTLKYSPDGALLWTKYYTGTQPLSWQDTPYEMALDASGSLYIAGMTYRRNSRGYLVGLSVVLKYDTNGNQVWVNTHDSPGENGSMAKQITIGPSGHIYVTGTVNGYVVSTDTTDSDIFTTKYDAAGNVLWRSHYDTPNDSADGDDVGDIKVDAQGNVYLGGLNRNTYLTIKYNPNGTLVWNNKLDVSYLEGIAEIALDAAGNIFVVGSAEFRHNSGLANDDVVTFKLDNNGNHLWTRTYTGLWNGNYTDDGAANVLIDSAGNAHVGIETRDEAGNYVFGLLKYTPDGTETIRTFRGPNAGGTDTPYDMAFDSAGNVYLAGTSYVVGQGSNFLVLKVAPGSGQMTPVITWNNPADIPYGTPLSDAQLNATANVPGTFEYTPAAGTVLQTGYNSLSVKFTPSDTNTYRATTKGVTLFVRKATAGITLSNLNQTYNGAAKAVTVVTNPPELNYTVSYSQNGVAVASPVNRGSYDVSVTVNNIYYEGTATGVLVISDKQTPVITWNNPAHIIQGTALGGAQLNATADVSGTFQYTPAAGTVLSVGTHLLSATFTPTDSVRYSSATRSVQLIVDPVAPVAPTLSFSSASYSVNESGAYFEVIVNRAGDLSAPATVTFTTANGTANSLSDYTIMSGTLRFAAGVANKTLYIPIMDDRHDEADETLTLTLSAPTGATLVTPAAATLTILDNDTGAATTNPLDEDNFFVRQHYMDFLNRVPDTGGLDYWASAITRCNGDPVCITKARTAVSAAFFIETEFRETGFFVYLLHKAVTGHRPAFSEFIADRPRVTTGPDAEASKRSLINELLTRPSFTDAFPASMTPEEYVDKLNVNTGGSLSQAERDALVQGMKANPQTETRASVLRKLVTDADFQKAEDQPSFVLMQYFGYLRRDPDQGGYDFWLGILKQNPANLKGMVCAFITSPEYQQRSSSVVTRVDSECSAVAP